jgi:hypothetical protein
MFFTLVQSTKSLFMVNFSKLSKVAFAAITLQLAAQNADAAVYTAVASGAYTSASTWSGGMVPPSVIANDQIIIGSGFTVMLNQQLELNGALASVSVDGTLDAATNGSLILNTGTLSGNGDIMADSVALNNTLTLAFTGSIETRKMSSNGTGLSLSTSADITVHNNLWLNGGVLDVASGMFNLDNNINLMISGGSMTMSGSGMINIASGYNVIYMDASSTAGWELTNAGLRNVEIRVPSMDKVTLSNDLMVTGMLSLTSGTLDLNGNDLTVTAGLSSTGTGMIESDANSDIVINSNTAMGGRLAFTATGNTVGDLTINMTGGNNILDLNSDLNVDGNLNLQSGKIDINDNDLFVDGIVNVTAGSGSYVITGSNGHLILDLAAGNSGMFYIGTESMYAPVMVMVNGSSNGGRIGTNVHSNVYVNSMSGAMLNTDQPLVNATWHVMTNATTNISMNVQPMWGSGMEVNGFSRSEAFVSTYTNGKWSMGTVGSATSANGLYMLSGINVTATDNAVAVFDKDAVTTSVGNTKAGETFAIYPNPATETLNFRLPAGAQVNAVTVMDVAGRVMQRTQLSAANASVSISELPAGLYNVQIEGNGFREVQKFVKQ